MKSGLFKLNTTHLIIIFILSVSIAAYYYQSLENFEENKNIGLGNTANTLANLPSWFVYSIIVFVMICALLGMILQFLPWMYGIKTAGNIGGRAVNGFFGKKNAIVPVKPVGVNSTSS